MKIYLKIAQNAAKLPNFEAACRLLSLIPADDHWGHKKNHKADYTVHIQQQLKQITLIRIVMTRPKYYRQ